MAMTPLTRALFADESAAGSAGGATPPPMRSIAPTDPMAAHVRRFFRTNPQASNEQIAGAFKKEYKLEEDIDPASIAALRGREGRRREIASTPLAERPDASAVAKASIAATTSSTVGNVVQPPIPVSTSGKAGAAPQPRVSVQTPNQQRFNTNDEFLRDYTKRILSGQADAPVMPDPVTNKTMPITMSLDVRTAPNDAAKELALFKALKKMHNRGSKDMTLPGDVNSEAQLAKRREVLSAKPEGTMIPKAPVTKATSTTEGSTITTNTVVPRSVVMFTRDAIPSARVAPIVLQQITQRYAGVGNNTAKFVNDYRDFAQTRPNEVDPTLVKMISLYDANKGVPQAQQSLDKLIKSYVSALHVRTNASKLGLDNSDVERLRKTWAGTANSVMKVLADNPRGSITAARKLDEMFSRGEFGAYARGYSKAAFQSYLDDFENGLSEMDPRAHNWGEKTTAARTSPDATAQELIRHGSEIARQKLGRQFTGTDEAGNLKHPELRVKVDAVSNLMQAILVNPNTTLAKKMRVDVADNMEKTGVNAALQNPATAKAMAAALAKRSGNPNTTQLIDPSTGKQIFDSGFLKLAAEAGIDKSIIGSTKLLWDGFGSAIVNADPRTSAQFSQRVNEAAAEVSKGTKTDWNKVSQLLRDYITPEQTKLMFPQMAMAKPTKKGADFSPEVHQATYFKNAFAKATGLKITDAGDLSGDTGRMGDLILTEIKANNPKLYQEMVRRANLNRGVNLDPTQSVNTRRKDVFDVAPGGGKKPGTTNVSTPVAGFNPKSVNGVQVWNALLNPTYQVQDWKYNPNTQTSDRRTTTISPEQGAQGRTGLNLFQQAMEASPTMRGFMGGSKIGETKVAPVGVIGASNTQRLEGAKKLAGIKPMEADVYSPAKINLMVQLSEELGVSPQMFRGLQPNADGTMAEKKLAAIMANPTTRKQYETLADLEKGLVGIFQKVDNNKGLGLPESSQRKTGTGKTASAITKVVSSIENMDLSDFGDDINKARAAKMRSIEYIRGFAKSAGQESAGSASGASNVVSWILRNRTNFQNFAALAPSSVPGKIIRPNNMSDADVYRFGRQIEDVIKRSGNEKLIIKYVDKFEPGRKALRLLSEVNSTAEVAAIVGDLNRAAKMFGASEASAMGGSTVKTPQGGPRGSTQVEKAAETGRFAGVQRPELGTVGPTGAGYKAPGAPTGANYQYQPFMGENSPESWVRKWTAFAKNSFQPGSESYRLAMQMGQKLGSNYSLEQILTPVPTGGAKAKRSEGAEGFTPTQETRAKQLIVNRAKEAGILVQGRSSNRLPMPTEDATPARGRNIGVTADMLPAKGKQGGAGGRAALGIGAATIAGGIKDIIQSRTGGK